MKKPASPLELKTRVTLSSYQPNALQYSQAVLYNSIVGTVTSQVVAR